MQNDESTGEKIRKNDKLHQTCYEILIHFASFAINSAKREKKEMSIFPWLVFPMFCLLGPEILEFWPQIRIPYQKLYISPAGHVWGPKTDVTFGPETLSM